MKRSFTLIELMISCAILTILIFALFQAMDTGRNLWFSGDVSMQLRQEIIKTFARMERELKTTRPAQINLTIGTSGPTLTFKIPQDVNGDGTILDAYGNIEWSPNITYTLNGANQITRTDSIRAAVIANNVTSLRFSRPISLANILQIDITVNKTTLNGRQLQDSGQLIIKMRN